MGYDPLTGPSRDCHDWTRHGQVVRESGIRLLGIWRWGLVEEKAMKTLRVVVVAAVALGLLAAPAAAQMGGKMKPQEKTEDPEAAKKKAAQDKAYKAALERIPDAKEKYDPWGGVVPADSGKKPK
jgi:hypothetical protein